LRSRRGGGLSPPKGIGFRVEGVSNSEVGPVVVPGGRDYAAASMRKWEGGREKIEVEKMGNSEAWRLGS
jgi:hypothetical protein